jgi:hypothetical protein
MPDKNKIIYEKMLSDIAEEKGGTTAKYRNLLGKIAYMESGGDPTVHQKSGGPGRGKYQFEGNTSPNASNRIRGSAVRTKRYFKSKGMETPSFVQKIIDDGTGDASILSESQQDMLALGDLRMGPVNMTKFAEGKLSDKDIYLDNWWAGKDKDHRNKLDSRWDEKDNAFKDSHLYTPDNDPLTQAMTGPYSQPDVYSEQGPVNTQMQAPNQMQAPENMGMAMEMQSGQQMQTPQKMQMQMGYGGDLNSYINQKAQGGLMNDKFNEFSGGGTHEQNPNGGIPQGMGSNGKLNTVEAEETSYDFPEGKFIFSNRINTDGKSSFINTTSNQIADGGKLNTSGCGGEGEPLCVERPMTIGKTANTVSNMMSNVNKYFFNSDENSLKESPYKPTVSAEKNIKYHQRPGMREDVYKDLTSEKVKKDYNHNGSFKDIYAGLKSNGTDRKHKANESFPKNKAGYKGQYNNGHGSLTGQFNFGRYNTDAGEDEKGKYISFHDVYDWNGMKTENSINFYDRIYEDEWNDLTKQEKKKVKDSFEKLKSFDKKSKNKKSYEYFKKK